MMSGQPIIFNYAPFLIESGKIKEFAKALQLNNPVYLDEEIAKSAGYRGIPAPPTFTTVIDFWNDRSFYQLFSDFLKLNPNNVLHGEQTYEYYKVMVVGDTISAQVRLKDQFCKKGKNFFLLETVYKNQWNETVAIGRATIIEMLEVNS
ncbi:hypothetical protein BCM40_02295 [Planococcus donghaensis]|uniref:FAS1-like dehydratase domain-containing protein n=2 Tax=Planococcus donghaensis TaxID=414778 RepID=A0A1C7EDY5_9BACL|nr:hypothetical protein BCM40_02295 [Planococcus donghaensis]